MYEEMERKEGEDATGRLDNVDWCRGLILPGLSNYADCRCRPMMAGVEFRQKIYLSDRQVDLQNQLSVMKSTCPTQENHKIKRLFNVAP